MSVKKSRKHRDYPSMKTIGVKSVDETFKVRPHQSNFQAAHMCGNLGKVREGDYLLEKSGNFMKTCQSQRKMSLCIRVVENVRILHLIFDKFVLGKNFKVTVEYATVWPWLYYFLG